MKTELRVVQCTVCGCTELNPALLTAPQEANKQDVPDDLPYETCSRCGLWVQFPPPVFQYEADDNSGNMKAGVLSEQGHFHWLSNRLFEAYKPKSVLDIGSSYPLFLHFMKNKHKVPEVQSLDGSVYAETYGEELEIPTIQSSFQDHDFGARRFDLICMTHVIEHFHEPLFPVMKMKKLLNPGGVIFIRTPMNDTDGFTRWHLTKYHFQVHPIVFGQRSLKTLFEIAGMYPIYEAVGNGVGHGDYDFRAK